jgi:hypothetical protein
MLDEEKQRKNFEKNLPKLEEELSNLASEYSKMNGGKMYTIRGSHFADYIQHVKNEFEESKKKEKLEKQIIRDNVRQTSSGKKRLLNEKSPHESKKTRIDAETTCINTPGSLLSNTRLHGTTQNNLIVQPSTAEGTKTKLTLSKRKSKTSNAKRKSRQLANVAAMAASNLAPSSANESTILSTNYYQDDTIIKSSKNSNTSNISSKVPKVTVTNNNGTSTQPHKYPPLSASSNSPSCSLFKPISSFVSSST